MPTVRLQPAGGGAPFEVTVEWGTRSGDSTELTLTSGDRTLAARGRIEPGGEGTLVVGTRTVPFYPARVGDELHLWMEGEVYRFALPRQERAARAGHDALPTTGEVPAPMPGRVLEVLVQAGQEVAARAPLVIIESMKTELTVTAPAPGRVREVRCAPGDMVDRDQLLVSLDAPGAP